MPEEDPLALAKSIDGFMGEHELRWLYDTARMFQSESIVEIGSWKGRSLAAIAAGMGFGTLFAVDNMSGKHSFDSASIGDDVHRAILIRNIKEIWDSYPLLRTQLIPHASAIACERFDAGELSMVFIDGDHRYLHVRADCLGWLPALRVRGILCGHDWNEPDVRAAVQSVLPGEVIENPVGSIWYWVKHDRFGVRRDDRVERTGHHGLVGDAADRSEA